MSSNDIAIRVANLSKRYEIYDNPRDRLKQFVLPRLKRMSGQPPKQYFREFWALKDVSFEVKKGETVGIIGRNGAGKSTLLQMICGTLNPTSGSVQTNGRIAALLELGSGFNYEFTGRENVRMSCTLLGLSPEETEARFDDIVAFADIGDFIEQPVKTYSSGMYLRLAFAVNIVSKPDVMIVDEALAVGDMGFQAKCMTALTRIQEDGATVLFVSHDVGSVKSLCSRAIYLEDGLVKSFGKAPDVAELYVRTMREEMNKEQQKFTRISTSSESSKPQRGNGPTVKLSDGVFKRSEGFDKRVAAFRYGSGGAKITFVELLDMEDQPIFAANFNQQVKLRIHFTVDNELTLGPAYYILDDKKNLILGAGPRQVGHSLLECIPGHRYIVTYETALPLQDGDYSVQVQLNKSIIPDQAAEFIDVIDDAIVFNVLRREEGRVWAKVLLPNALEVVEA